MNSNSNREIRTRIAPSPTGDWHLGTARTALFAYLFARRNNGKFFLRVEDTDRNRLVPGAVERIIEVMAWLKLDTDTFEGQDYVVQSERLPRYQEVAQQLVREGKAYYCFATPEDLQTMRDEQTAAKLPPRYDNRWGYRDSSLEAAEKRVAAGDPHVIRQKMPQTGTITVRDLVHGDVTVDAALLDDHVLLKADGFPTYHLAHVVDDQDMEITHVIRGDEWLPSAPRHVALIDLLGWERPQYAHLPVILGPDGSKLSKRHGAQPTLAYRDAGYLPDAVANYLLHLGWSSGTDKEVYSRQEMIAAFSFDRVQPNPAKFDAQKLEWFNQVYIQNELHLAQRVADWYASKGDSYWTAVREAEQTSGGRTFINLVEAMRTKLKTLADFAPTATPYYEAASDEDLRTVLGSSKLSLEEVSEGLAFIKPHIEALDIPTENFESATEELRTKLFAIIESAGKRRGDVLWPLRAALSQQKDSPGAFESLVILGKATSLKRIDNALRVLASV